MRKSAVYLPEELVSDLKALAQRRGSTVAELTKRAIETLYEADLDAILVEREVEQHGRDPFSSISLDDYLASRRSAVRG